MTKTPWEALGLLLAHLLFSISSPDGVTCSHFYASHTQEPVQPVLWREALMAWGHQYFTKTEPSSQPGDQHNRKQLSFSPRSFYQGFALRAYLKRTSALRKCEGTPVKWTIPLLVFLAGREPFYWARTNSQDFTYTISRNPHNIVKLVVLFLLTEIQTYRKQIERDWTTFLKPLSYWSEIHPLTVKPSVHLGVALPSTPHTNAS